MCLVNSTMSREQILFDEIFRKVNFYLSFSGAYIDKKDSDRNVFRRFSTRWFWCFNMVWLSSAVFGEILWIIDRIEKGTATILKLTYTLPCMTLCVIGMAKSYYMIKNGDLVQDFTKTMKLMQVNSVKTYHRVEIEKETNRLTTMLISIYYINIVIYMLGFLVFAIGPVVLSWLMYKSTGKLVMQLPFLYDFPFDETDIRFWPFAYIHQMWCAVIAISTVLGADSFYAYSCTFLVIQFKTLHFDIQRIFKENGACSAVEIQDERDRLMAIVNHHNELIRCVSLVEIIFTKSTLGNVAVSAIVMCAAAFTMTTIDDISLMTLFLGFLIIWTLQIFVLCYYGDKLIESSTGVSNAVYQTKWYSSNAAIMKDLLFVIIRAQKPCKLTALGFTDLNLRVFSKICGSAWSYFALLKTLYSDKQMS